jgi:hypothetical protein
MPSTPSTEQEIMDRLGARLTAEDVAKVVWTAATYRGSLGKVHWPVGFMARRIAT